MVDATIIVDSYSERLPHICNIKSSELCAFNKRGAEGCHVPDVPARITTDVVAFTGGSRVGSPNVTSLTRITEQCGTKRASDAFKSSPCAHRLRDISRTLEVHKH